MASWTSAALLTWIRETLQTIDSVTSSRESADGLMLCVSRGGLTIKLYGQGAAPASLSAPLASDLAPPTSATSGPSSTASSRSAALQSSLESRLRARTDVNGSPEYALTWRQWDMLSGPPICALRARGRPISDSGYIGWPTTIASDHKSRSASQATLDRDARPLREIVRAVCPSGWATPRQTDAEKNVRSPEGAAKEIARKGGQNDLGVITGLVASTEKRGALNPAHSRWLMGFPPEWDDCGVTAMPSSRKSRPSLSAPVWEFKAE